MTPQIFLLLFIFKTKIIYPHEINFIILIIYITNIPLDLYCSTGGLGDNDCVVALLRESLRGIELVLERFRGRVSADSILRLRLRFLFLKQKKMSIVTSK